jgi:RimJ/RimL family protein N-acetyltransferase
MSPETETSPGDSKPSLRPVLPSDVQTFFEFQQDEEASEMAAFGVRGRAEHFAHWDKILADETLIARTIECEGAVAGNVVSWTDGDKRLVGYWIGKPFWGRGIATSALASLLTEIEERPLYAYVATHNVGSIRVLEKCGFVPTGPPEPASDAAPGVTELEMKLAL